MDSAVDICFVLFASFSIEIDVKFLLCLIEEIPRSLPGMLTVSIKIQMGRKPKAVTLV